MQSGAPRSFGAQLKGLRESAGFTQEELATIAGLSVHAVSGAGTRAAPAASRRDGSRLVGGTGPDWDE